MTPASTPSPLNQGYFGKTLPSQKWPCFIGHLYQHLPVCLLLRPLGLLRGPPKSEATFTLHTYRSPSELSSQLPSNPVLSRLRRLRLPLRDSHPAPSSVGRTSLRRHLGYHEYTECLLSHSASENRFHILVIVILLRIERIPTNVRQIPSPTSDHVTSHIPRGVCTTSSRPWSLGYTVHVPTEHSVFSH